MILFLGGFSFNIFNELLVFTWNFITFQQGTSSNKFWFTEIMPVYCLKHLNQTDILDWLIHCKMMWCKFWWCNISHCNTIVGCSDLSAYAVYWSNNTPTQPSFIGMWTTTFTMYDLCWLQCLHAVRNLSVRPSSFCTISFDINLRCFHSLILARVAISSLSTGIFLFAYNLESVRKLPSPLIPVTCMSSTTIALSVFSPCNALRFKVVFRLWTPSSLTKLLWKKEPWPLLPNIA